MTLYLKICFRINLDYNELDCIKICKTKLNYVRLEYTTLDVIYYISLHQIILNYTI